MPLPVSVLDLSPISAGSTGVQALRNTLDLAQLADRLGYHRYWVAEHHNIASVASTAPEIMIAQVASATKRLRVGSGGIMLPNHAPLHVAEVFRVLEALHPGRIDLGLGRAPGSDTLTALAMRRTKERLGADDFAAQLEELFSFGSGRFPPGHPFRNVHALPEEAPLPPVWILGSSDYGARLAAAQGLPFGFAHHFSPKWVLPAMRAYREEFQPSEHLKKPHSLLTISVICAETDAEANRLATSMDLTWLRRSQGEFAPLPSVEEALAYPYTSWDREFMRNNRSGYFIGSPATVRGGIEVLVRETGADEVMINTMIHGHAERRRSYELLAAEFALPSG